jgi:1,4-dihydroxy-2-naphthoyl-CoA synthase
MAAMIGLYQYESQETSGDEDLATDARREHIEKGRLGRLHILEVQRLMRATPKPIIAAIPGFLRLVLVSGGSADPLVAA